MKQPVYLSYNKKIKFKLDKHMKKVERIQRKSGQKKLHLQISYLENMQRNYKKYAAKEQAGWRTRWERLAKEKASPEKKGLKRKKEKKYNIKMAGNLLFLFFFGELYHL